MCFTLNEATDYDVEQLKKKIKWKVQQATAEASRISVSARRQSAVHPISIRGRPFALSSFYDRCVFRSRMG